MLLRPIAAQEQSTTQRVGVITGQVIDAAGGKPVSAAVVSISGSEIPPAGPNAVTRVLTGADGRFVLRDLPVPGSFTVVAAKGGYADGSYGQKRPNGSRQSVELNAAQKQLEIS